MAKSRDRSILYRLIEAGQLARLALLPPLRQRGLEAGDDALLFLLAGKPGLAEAEIGAAIGIGGAPLHSWLARLVAHDLIGLADGGVTLTERGARLTAELDSNWRALETGLAQGLKPKARKHLSRRLAKFSAALR